MNDRYALFLGCTIPARGRNYEMSARQVARRLDVEFVDIAEFCCCGFPVKSTFQKTALVLAGRNLALAEQRGLDICALCSACASSLAESAHQLNHNEELRNEINMELANFGLNYNGKTNVYHFTRILYEFVGLDKIKASITRELNGFRFAAHYGCHYLKPSEYFGRFDSPERPRSLDALIEATGAEAVQYQDKLQCCGGSVLAVDENLAFQMAGDKLSRLKQEGVDALISICPFCTVMYDDNQKKIESVIEKELGIPVLYLTQLFGLAMGLGGKELGLQMNKVKTRTLLERIESGEAIRSG
ncbi:CoB--CoM heterodisulfide reductase iron-sulfur subunit B family protein [Candidatus Sumerlaeota bacterium]|nr:CoB--CoM heterodisulfide reductase iron-sulfur subunit B family protein [Candidatus Sumerlaeota bacterium]